MMNTQDLKEAKMLELHFGKTIMLLITFLLEKEELNDCAIEDVCIWS